VFLYVIYQNPSDYPGFFCVRKWTVLTCPPSSVALIGKVSTLEEARELIPQNKEKMPVFLNDDPVIVEVWACIESTIPT
jgi:hypothetical protein